MFKAIENAFLPYPFPPSLWLIGRCKCGRTAAGMDGFVVLVGRSPLLPYRSLPSSSRQYPYGAGIIW